MCAREQRSMEGRRACFDSWFQSADSQGRGVMAQEHGVAGHTAPTLRKQHAGNAGDLPPPSLSPHTLSALLSYAFLGAPSWAHPKVCLLGDSRSIKADHEDYSRGVCVRIKILNPGPQEAWTPLTLKKSFLPSLSLSSSKFGPVFKTVVLMRGISLPKRRVGDAHKSWPPPTLTTTAASHSH